MLLQAARERPLQRRSAHRLEAARAWAAGAHAHDDLPSPDISRTPVEARTVLPFECPFIEVSNLDARADSAEAKL